MICLACHETWKRFYKEHDCDLGKYQSKIKELEAKLDEAVKIIRCVSGMDVTATGANNLFVNIARSFLEDNQLNKQVNSEDSE